MTRQADVLVTHAHLFTMSGQGVGYIADGAVAVQGQRIAAVGFTEELVARFRAAEIIDASGCAVLPGLIDVHTHLRDLRLAYKEDFYSGTCAALAGGFTTVLDMPNTAPLTDSALRLQEKMAVARGRIVANTGFYACLPAEVSELHRLKALGAMGCKVYLHHPHTSLAVDDDAVLRQVLENLEDLDMILAVHAEDRRIITDLEARYQDVTPSSPRLRLQTHPPRAEVQAVHRVLSLLRGRRLRLHFCHISTGEASSLISRAKVEGAVVTYEATPHHLFLTETRVQDVGRVAFVEPPLRPSTTQRRLWRDLLAGRIDVVASDHAPHALTEKQQADLWAAPSGFPGLETTLPLLLTRVARGELALDRLGVLLARNPARIFRLEGKGVIAPGFDADLTVVDMEREYLIDASSFHSKAKYSPFEGMKVVGRPVQVFLGGRLAMDAGEILVKPGSGTILRPASPAVG